MLRRQIVHIKNIKFNYLAAYLWEEKRLILQGTSVAAKETEPSPSIHAPD